MSKTKHLYGSEEDFSDLREIGAIRVYVKHRVKLERRKKELEDNDITTYTQQAIWEKLDKAIKHWKEIEDMVYKGD